MTPSQLKYEVEAAGHERHFFDRSTMKFFGDTMSNYGVRSIVITCNYNEHGQYVEEGVLLPSLGNTGSVPGWRVRTKTCSHRTSWIGSSTTWTRSNACNVISPRIWS